MPDVLIGLHMPYHDPLEKIVMEYAAETALSERGIDATVEIVGTDQGYIAARGQSVEVAKELATIAENAARDVYDRQVP